MLVKGATDGNDSAFVCMLQKVQKVMLLIAGHLMNTMHEIRAQQIIISYYTRQLQLLSDK